MHVLQSREIAVRSANRPQFIARASPFLENLQWGEVPRPFASREAMTAEVRALRRQHNFSPDNAIEAVAIALRASVDEAALDTALARLPVQAAGFWAMLAR